MECAIDLCCRSINYKKTTTLKNESNCEMLHHVVYNNSEILLEKNFSYDYAYLVDPRKVRIYKLNCSSGHYSIVETRFDYTPYSHDLNGL